MPTIYSFLFPNGKMYIGFTKRTNVNDRWSQHRRDSLKLKDSKQPKLYAAIRKYGFDNIEKNVIYSSEDFEHTLHVMEDYYIQYYNTIENGYNVCRGGGKFPILLGEENPSANRKGRPMSEWFSADKIDNHKKSMTKRHSGSGNVHARKVKIIDPLGNEYIVHGKMQSFCDYHQISFKALYRCLNEKNGGTIDPIGKKANNLVYRDMRERTTGWSIFPLD
jgi:hypothetical protein